MDGKVISSPANSVVKNIRALQRHRHREEEGAFFVEGIRPVWQAIASGADVELIVHAPELLTSEAARELIETPASQGLKIITVTGKVFESIAQREHPSGLGAVVRAKRRKLQDLSVSGRSIFVALDKAGNPGNVGTIIRTLDAVGGSGVVLVEGGADPYHPAAVKASMGSLFTVPIVIATSLDELFKWSHSQQVTVVTTSPRASSPYWSVHYRFPLLLLFGGEAEGLSGEAVEQGDIAVHIPMAGAADSLNLAVSVGVLLYEVERQRSGITDSLRAIP